MYLLSCLQHRCAHVYDVPGQGLPYEQVVQKARILRLQKNLDGIRAAYLRTNGGNQQGLLDLALSTVENLSRQVRGEQQRRAERWVSVQEAHRQTSTHE